MIDLNVILADAGITPATTIVMRHQPVEPELRRVFPTLALERRELFDAYQSSHGEKTEKALARAAHLASFIANGAGQALFVGLYDVSGYRSIDRAEQLMIEANRQLTNLGMTSMMTRGRERALWFDLRQRCDYQDWSGKLVVGWPTPDRSWWRWADRNVFPIRAVHDENVLEARPPSWDQLVINWIELGLLPRRLRAGLSEWRGVYLITDRSDGARYVGAAYGIDNLYGRWQSYAIDGHGGNKLLMARNPRNFDFSILQRVSPDQAPEEVVALENSWKTRLGTRGPQGLNAN